MLFGTIRSGGVLILALCCAAVAHSQITHSYAADAYREYAAVFGHSDNPCTDDGPVPYETCMAKELAFIDPHLNAFVTAIRGVLSARTASQKRGVEEGEVEMLNKADAVWREYRNHVCRLSYGYFRTGSMTTVTPEVEICKLRLSRAYMQQLLPLANLEQ